MVLRNLGRRIIAATVALALVLAQLILVAGTADAAVTWTPQYRALDTDLNAIDMVDSSIGYAVGATGSMWKTNDGGASFSPINTPTSNDLFAVDFVDGLRGFVVGDGGVVLATVDGGTSWVQQSHGAGSVQFNSVDFTDALNGTVVGVGPTIMTTTDGGATWVKLLPIVTDQLEAMDFPTDAVTGYAVGLGGRIVKTSNGGVTWASLISPTTDDLYGLDLLADGVTGYIVGRSGIIFKTTDAGASWVAQTSGVSDHLYGVHFPVDATTGYVTGASGTILTTTDGGTTWTPQTSGTTKHLHNPHFPTDTTTGYVVGDSGTILTTTDGGTTWTPQTSGTTKHLHNPHFPTDTTTGYVVGDSGTILTTTDGGTTWTTQTSGTTKNLYTVDFVDDATGYAAGESGTILKTTDNGTTWNPQTSGTTKHLYGITFPVDATTGAAIGQTGTTLSTSDGGTTWNIPTSVTNEHLNAIHYSSPTVAYAAGDSGTIIKSTDAGQSWTAQTSGVTKRLYGIHFATDTTGYTVGESGTILTTTDGGTTWTPQTSSTTKHLNAVSFADASTGYAIGDSGAILYTTDGGSTWSAQNHAGGTSNLTGVDFADALNGTVVGVGPTILTTSDGGTTWTLRSNVTDQLEAVDFPTDAVTGYAVGLNGRFMKTTDGGVSWEPQASPTGDDLYGIDFLPDGVTGYIVGRSGIIFKTTDAGATWAAQTSGVSDHLYAVTFLDSSNGYVVGNAGVILETVDGGATWNLQTHPAGAVKLTGVSFTNSSNGTAVGVGPTILTTADGGATWALRSPTTENLVDVDFPVDNTTGYGVGQAGRVTKTSDGGVSWQPVTSPTTTDLNGVDFLADAVTGWVVGAGGVIFQTTDGGASWAAQTSGVAQHLLEVDFVDGLRGFVVGAGGVVLATVDGGTSWVQQSHGGGSVQFNSVDFTDALNGTVVGVGPTIMTTTDGGATWVKLLPIVTDQLEAMDFTDATTGYAVGLGGRVMKTSNGGVTWASLISPTTDDLYGLDFLADGVTGYIVGRSGIIFKTTDAGASWVSQTSGVSDHLYAAHFPVDATTGYVTGATGTILTTTDGGTTWTPQTPGVTDDLLGVRFPIDTTTGYAVGDSGTILTTVDSGATWTPQVSGVGDDLHAVHFPTGITTGYATGLNGTIVATTTAGATWTPQTSGVTKDLYTVDFVDDTTGYAAGESGTILKTTDNGATWTPQTSGTTKHVYGITFPVDATTGAAIGQNGTTLSTGDAGTTWNTPTVATTEPLKALHYSSPTVAYATGENGTIIKTTDAGQSWTAQTSGVTKRLFGVHFATDTTGYTVGETGTILTTTNGGTTWTPQTSTTTKHLQAVSFPVDATTGFVVGDLGTTLRTTDSGATWAPSTFPTAEDLIDVYYSSPTIGYATGKSGTIIKTTDAGVTWSAQTSGVTKDLNAVYFLDDTVGYAAGHTGTILKTVDGGSNWVIQDATTRENLLDVFFPVDATNGFTVGKLAVTPYTTDGGTTWSQGAASDKLFGIDFPVDGLTGYAAGRRGMLVKTANGGTTWELLSSGTSVDLFDVEFPADVLTGWIVGKDGTVLATADAGSTWTPQTSGTTEDLFAADFADNSSGWMAGKRGTIIATIDGGASWGTQATGVTKDLRGIHFPVDALTGYAAGQDGTILKTTDGGTTWVEQTTPTSEDLYGIHFPVDATTGYAAGRNATILKTADGGATWNIIVPPSGADFTDIQFATVLIGWTVDTDGLILSTTDGGSSWSTEASATTDALNAIDFVNTIQGFAVGNGPWIIARDDPAINSAPVADPIADEFPNEGDTVSLTATATDAELDNLTWSQDSGPGAVDAMGNYSWTTAETDGPGTYTVVLRVVDDGVPSLVDTVSFDVTVAELNLAPVLDPVGGQSGDELTLISFTATASDTDVPADGLTFTLANGPGAVPPGALITAGGDFTWTPTETQGGAAYTFDVVVTDDGTGTLSDFETITVTVNDTNTAPVLDPVGPQSGDELTLISFTATASDSDDPADGVTFTLVDGPGAVPPGAVITAGGDFTWTPTEAQGGAAYTFDVVVTDDGTGTLSDFETITVTVNDTNTAPVLDPVGPQSGDELTLISFTATASDSDDPADGLTFTLANGPGTVPPGAAITAGGDFTWTPTEAQGGAVYTFDVVVTDNGTGTLSDSETITVTVGEVNRSPVLDPVGAQSGDELTLISFTAAASDPDVPANGLTFTLADGPGAVPPGAGINPLSGVFDWTPTEAQGGAVYTFDVIVTDNGTGTLSDSETITVTVGDTNTAPVLDPVGAQSGDELTLISFIATASDSDDPADGLTFTLADGLGAVPTGAVITAGGDFTWTPTEAQGPGAYTFDVVVTDDGTGTLTDFETITVTVGDANVAPVLDPVGAQSGDELTLISFTATATDSDDPADGLTFTLTDGPGAVPPGAVITAGGDFTWTPSENQGGAAYTFDVVVTDDGTGTLSDSETITVTVGDTNTAPVLDPVGAQSGDEQTLITFTATASDTDDPADGLTFTLADGPGAVPTGAFITAGGGFTWTPSEAQGDAVYTFDVVVTDDGAGALFDSETITVTVGEANRSPVLDPIGAQSGDELTLITFTATASDPDMPANGLTFTLANGPGTIPPGAAITAGGDFTWTPTETQGPGVYTFDVVVTDNGTGTLSDSETITVTVGDTNTAPVLDPVGAQSGDELTPITFTATATDSDDPADGLSFTLTDGPGTVPPGAVITAGGDFTWTPTEAQGGAVYTFDVVVTDDGTGALSDSETITVTVNDTNTAPVLDPVGAQSGDEQTLISFTATASDSDDPADGLTFTLANGPGTIPPGAAITAGGDFTWTPTETQGPGVYTFDVVVADDGTGTLSDSETITVTVGEVNRSPVLDPIGAQSGDELTLISFTAAASDPDVPANGLTFTLANGPGAVPPGAAVTSGGDFTWTPTEAQGGAAYTFDVVVTDNGTGTLSDSETITVTVTDTNTAPALDLIGAQTGDEQTLITFTATASDSDDPADGLTFTLANGPGTIPPGAAITTSGDFTWTPTETQGGTAYTFDVVVTDDGTGTLSDSETITVTVNDTNTAPVLDPVGPQSGDEQTPITFTATASDSDDPANGLTFTLANGPGTIPPGAAITTGGDFTWTPTETQGPGVYTFDVVVADDGTGTLSDSETITVTVGEVNRSPVLDPVGAQSGDEHNLMSFTVSASDPDLPSNGLAFSLANGPGAVPPGAAITTGGVFTWTPTETHGPGVYTFDVVVTDDGTGALTDSETITVTINEANGAPILDPIGAHSGDELTLITFTATASDSDVPADGLTFTLANGPGTIPPGAAITTGGVFTWTPTETQGGTTYTFDVVVADDGTGTLSDSETITVTVDDTNTAPVLDPIGAQSGDELTLITFTATASDSDVPADGLTFSLANGPGTIPPGAAITTGGVFTWTPTETQGGTTYTFNVVVTDNGTGTLSDSETITVTVDDTNTAPVLDPIGAQSGDELTLITFTATASDSDVPADGLTFTLANGPGTIPPGAAITTGGVFTWTPTETQGGTTYTFNVVVTDNGTGTLSDSETITVTVRDVNAAPVLVDPGDQTNAEGLAISLSLTASDADIPVDILTWSATGLPEGLTIAPATGVISGTPSATAGAGSPYSVVVAVVDNGVPAASSSISFLWTINETPVPPVARDDAFDVEQGGTITIRGRGVLANDTDPSGGPLTARIVTVPSSGDVVLRADGSFTYSHDGGSATSDQFRYAASSPSGDETVATVRISITPLNRVPVASDDTVEVSAGESVTLFPLANDSDPDGDPLTIVEIDSPIIGSLETSGEEVTYTAPVGSGETVTITYVIADPTGDTAEATITILIVPTNRAPIGTTDIFNLESYASHVLDVLSNDLDADGDILTIVSAQGDTAGRLELRDGTTLIYHPKPGWTGTDLFSYDVADGSGSLASVSVVVTISEAAQVLAASLSESLGTPALAFASPKSALTQGVDISVSLMQGVSLLSTSFIQTFEALTLPTGFLLIALVFSLVLGGSAQIPLLLASRRRRYWSVVTLDRETILPVKTEPSADSDAIYNYEPTARGIQSYHRPTTVDGIVWLPIDTPAGKGWVEARYVTEDVAVASFMADERPAEIANELIALLDAGANFDHLTGPRGLAVAFDNRPVLIPAELVSTLMDSVPAHVPRGRADIVIEQFRQLIAEPLGSALLDVPKLSPETTHSKSALIPVEMWNFPYISVQAAGHRAWLLYFEYVGGEPVLVGMGIDE